MKAYWMGSAKVYNADEVDDEIERLKEQIRYEQERNENNVALADREEATTEELSGIPACPYCKGYENEMQRLNKEAARLRTVMTAEADRHDSSSPVLLRDGRTTCLCPFCRIAREGR